MNCKVPAPDWAITAPALWRTSTKWIRFVIQLVCFGRSEDWAAVGRNSQFNNLSHGGIRAGGDSRYGAGEILRNKRAAAPARDS